MMMYYDLMCIVWMLNSAVQDLVSWQMLNFFFLRTEIDSLMAKYLGQEHTMYLKICKKYNVTPEPEIKAGDRLILSDWNPPLHPWDS